MESTGKNKLTISMTSTERERFNKLQYKIYKKTGIKMNPRNLISLFVFCGLSIMDGELDAIMEPLLSLKKIGKQINNFLNSK